MDFGPPPAADRRVPVKLRVMADVEPGITHPPGFRAAGGPCGIKPTGGADLALIVADTACVAAGVLTRNRIQGAPVRVTRRRLRGGRARAILCNSGVANVCTGEQGKRDVTTTTRRLARSLDCPEGQVLPASTGIIGHRLPAERIEAGIESLVPALDRGPAVDRDVALAILTTDLVPKATTRELTLGGSRVRVGAVAKGSGMIAPNMATLLAFVTTDAAVTAPALQRALRTAADRSFNRISVDHDTSTSDMLLALANGSAGNVPVRAADEDETILADALADACGELAERVVRDGEGATRLFRVAVRGARSERDADRVGHTVVGSPLVKTAVHGADPNWGRIVMAVGRSGADIRPERLTVRIGDHPVVRGGEPVTDASRADLAAAMQGDEVRFEIDLGVGTYAADWLGCDLSAGYVEINTEYTT